MSDERKNLPSASSIERYFHCNGSFLLERQVPESERITSKDADRGTLLHEARERGDVSGLKLTDADVVREMAKTEERIFLQWTDEFQIKDAEIVQENRLWLTSGKKKLCSGKCDFYAVSQSKKMALILDRKSGRKEVSPPPSNWQLRTQAVILTANYSLIHCRVGIVQPLRKTQPLCDYSAIELFQAWNQLSDLLKKVNDPESKRVPGTHCEFCNARHICPEAKGEIGKLAGLKGMAWATLTPAQKLDLFKLCKQAKPIIKAILENIATEMASNPESIPGLVKKPDQKPREFTDLKGVQDVMLAKFPGMNQEQFLELCSMSLGDFKEYYRKVSGQSEEDADRFINSELSSFILTKTKRGSVELAE